MRLSYNIEDPADHRLIEAACQRLDAEMKSWASGNNKAQKHFDGTILSLVGDTRLTTKSISRTQMELARARNSCPQDYRGGVRGALSRFAYHEGLSTLVRCREAAEDTGGPERIDRAVKIMKLLRQMITYGKTAELPHCARLHAILKDMPFKGPARRRVKLELHHVEAFISMAIDMAGCHWHLARPFSSKP